MSSRRTPPAAATASTASGSGAKPAVLVAVAVLAVVAVVGAVLLIGNGRGGDDAIETAGAPFGMAHVHGLGLDDGQLVAGTHYGAFRVDEDGSVTQVGPTQDYMGFTVVGSGHYLASGHPGAGQGLALPADDGNRFQLVEAAPVMVLITWTDEDAIVGIDAQGALHVSPGPRQDLGEARGPSAGSLRL